MKGMRKGIEGEIGLEFHPRFFKNFICYIIKMAIGISELNK
jgi:hypothetical protein